MATSKIEWTETTWNPTTGCTKISQGCKNCYAETMHKRLRAMGLEKYQAPFSQVVCHENELARPGTWKKPTMCFVNSMSDLFHADVPVDFIQRVFRAMNETPQHTYQVLTKRAERLAELAPFLHWTPNIWQGVSVEDEKALYRIDYLRAVPAAVRFLSCEPLIGPLYCLNLAGIHWVIVGGESGQRARPMLETWIDMIHAQCRVFGSVFFFKQWGGRNKKAAGRLFRGREWNEMPEHSSFTVHSSSFK